MEILLSPRTSANVWIQARRVQARVSAKLNNHPILDNVDMVSPLIPPMQSLLAHDVRRASSLQLSTSKDELQILEGSLGIGKLGLAACRAAQRRTNPHDNWMLLPARFRDEEVLELGDGVYICPAGISFLSVAKSLKLPVLVQLLTELCGKYALDSGIKRGFDECPALLDLEELEKLVQRCGGLPGVEAMRKALPYVGAGSESPRETIMQLRLCLPTLEGGAHLPKGEFGKEIALSTAARNLYGRKSCRCDLYFEGAGLDLEYESDLEHSGELNRKKDARREAALALEGVEVIPVTSQELESISHMNAIAALVAKRLGVRQRVRVKDYPLLQLNLADTLLARKGWSF